MRTGAGEAVGVLCLVSLVAALDYKYHHSEELEAYLKEVHAAYPALTHLHSIGRSVEDCWERNPAPFDRPPGDQLWT